MKKASAMRWVKALRSGKYKQWDGGGLVTGAEDGKVRHCCLGVLCDITKGAKVTTKFTAKFTNDAHILSFEFKDSASSSFLPSAVAKEHGLLSREGTPLYYEEIEISKTRYSSLAEANDAGVSFARIATWIEKNYEKL